MGGRTRLRFQKLERVVAGHVADGHVVHGRPKVLERAGALDGGTRRLRQRVRCGASPCPDVRRPQWAGIPEPGLRQVQVQCGLENKLLSVSEPAKCEYVITMTTPAACTAPTAAPTAAPEPDHDEL